MGLYVVHGGLYRGKGVLPVWHHRPHSSSIMWLVHL